MPDEYDNDLLREGVLHFKSKDYAMARRYFERALAVADDLQTQAQANFYLSQVEEDPAQKRKFLEETLAIDMGHAAARRSLAILDGRLKPAEVINPNDLPVTGTGTQTAQAERFTCPHCGGRMVYTPDGASLSCENCSSRQKIDTALPGPEQDFFVAMANGKGFQKTISTRTFQCQGCGANFLLAPSELSATCAYCGSPHVLIGDAAREVVIPDAIIPMAVDQEHANSQLVQWVKKKNRSLSGRMSPLQGLYLPVWAFNIIGSIPWSGRSFQNKRLVPVSGENSAIYNNVCIPASSRLGHLFQELLPGFNLAATPAYEPGFLAGWPAQISERAMSDAALEARSICVNRILGDIRSLHGELKDLLYSASTISVTSYRLILLPVWVTGTTSGGTAVRLVINGQIGTVLAEKTGRASVNLLTGLPGKEIP
jgi:Zn finger protein HypA/HybF involved in hydrogenase expression